MLARVRQPEDHFLTVSLQLFLLILIFVFFTPACTRRWLLFPARSRHGVVLFCACICTFRFLHDAYALGQEFSRMGLGGSCMFKLAGWL